MAGTSLAAGTHTRLTKCQQHKPNPTRYVQCEQAISKFGLLGKHPTTGAAIASPFVAMSQSFGKQTNVYWYEIYEIVRATCTTDYAGTTPGEEVMEQLLNAHY